MSPRGRPRGRSRRRAEPRNAQEAIETLLGDELGRRGFPISLETEAERVADRRGAEERARPHRAADLHRRPGDGARFRRCGLRAARGRRDQALDPHRRRRRPRAPRLPARPRGAAPRQQHLRPGHGRADAAARAQRGRLQPLAGRRAACGDGRDRARRRRSPGGTSFYRSRIRSDARLDYDQLDVVFSGRSAPPEEVAEPLALARDAAARLGEQRNDRRGLEVDRRAGVPLRPLGDVVGPAPCRRPSPTG